MSCSVTWESWLKKEVFLMNIMDQMVSSKCFALLKEVVYIVFHCYRWLSVIIYTVFLFLVITMLLNLLIAQMSDTYANVQSDAQRSLFIDRAWIVAKVEHSSLFASALIVRCIYAHKFLCNHFIWCRIIEGKII